VENPKYFLLVECRFPIDSSAACNYHHNRKQPETNAFFDYSPWEDPGGLSQAAYCPAGRNFRDSNDADGFVGG